MFICYVELYDYSGVYMLSFRAVNVYTVVAEFYFGLPSGRVLLSCMFLLYSRSAADLHFVLLDVGCWSWQHALAKNPG